MQRYAIAAALAIQGAVAKPVGTIGTVTRQVKWNLRLKLSHVWSSIKESVSRRDSGSELVALYSEPAYVNPIYVLSLRGETSYGQV